MSRIHFIGDDPARALAKSRALADDLARLAAGNGPTPADFADAPILDRWAFGAMLQPVLIGSVVGHPRLGNRPSIHTTPLFAMDATHESWARTWSRFYRLGRRLDGDHGRDQ